nr:EOG090X07TK [Cyclestheria hislopi]
MEDSKKDLEPQVGAGTSSTLTNPDEEDSGITLVDVLEEEAQLEEDADAVLGGSDDQNCTYSLGYVKRQALYACITCSPNLTDNNCLAGICLACSYHCHDGHELIELYTKRNFRCDCGNSKFPKNKCTLNMDKESVNSENQYNHNFSGLYCICNKPYPDPEDLNPDDMVQCVICEDWYHTKHLGRTPPAESDYSEMTCDYCMKKHSFLQAYVELNESKTKPSVQCKLESWESGNSTLSAVFWPTGWRNLLCQCDKCLELYKKDKLEFLSDEQDTVESYEEKGKAAKQPSHNDRLMMALSSLDRVQQVEAIQEYQSFSAELKEYLKKFAENKKIVREEDIREFFGQLKERKRQRTSLPYFCR